MGLDLWFQEDVTRILASAQETMRASQAATVANEEYQQGFVDALRAVGMAFGVAAPRGSAHVTDHVTDLVPRTPSPWRVVNAERLPAGWQGR